MPFLTPQTWTAFCAPIDEVALILTAESRCLKRFSGSLLDCPPDNLRRVASFGTPDCPLFNSVHILDLHVEDLSSIIPYLTSPPTV